jgi:hypothetical protein
VSGGDETDPILEYILSDARGLIQLRPFVPGSYGRRFPRLGVGKAYPFVGSPRVRSTGTRVPSPSQRERLDVQSGGKILAACANRRVKKR